MLITRRLRSSRSSSEAPAEPDFLGDVTIAGRIGQAYGEQAFRYFLTVERKRAERSGRPFLLLLVQLRKEAGSSRRIAARLFPILWGALRETDFIGWFRDGRVIGAVLVQPSEVAAVGASRVVLERVTEALSSAGRSGVFEGLRLRIYRLPRVRRKLP